MYLTFYDPFTHELHSRMRSEVATLAQRVDDIGA